MVVSTTSAALNAVLEPGWLSDRVGRPVEAKSVRIKPGTSLLVGFQGTGTNGEDAPGWLRVMWPAGAKKAARHELKSQALGLDAPVSPALPQLAPGFYPVSAHEAGTAQARGFEAGSVVQFGSVLSDPKLMDVLQSTGALKPLAGAHQPSPSVLRYNPARRLVVLRGRRVERVLAGGGAPDTAIHRFVGDYLPVPPLLEPATDTGLPALGFVGTRDLSEAQTEQQAAAAGELFARLHACILTLPVTLMRALEKKAPSSEAGSSGSRQLSVHASVLESLDTELADRCQNLARALPPVAGALVLLHGDASPDQVITDDGDQLWLTDFARAQLGPVALDLGSYSCTSSPQAAAAFLEGYRAAGGARISPEDLLLGSAHALALRAVEPLRQARPTWREDIARNLARIENLL